MNVRHRGPAHRPALVYANWARVVEASAARSLVGILLIYDVPWLLQRYSRNGMTFADRLIRKTRTMSLMSVILIAGNIFPGWKV